MIRNYITVSAKCPDIVVEKGGEKRKRKEMCGGTHKTFPLWFSEERNKVLTLSLEGILDVEAGGVWVF